MNDMVVRRSEFVRIHMSNDLLIGNIKKNIRMILKQFLHS